LIDTFLGAPREEDWRLYTPVIRAKASEWKALQLLTPGIRQRISPILEFVPDWDAPGAVTSVRKRRAPQTPHEYVARMLRHAVEATPHRTRSFIYFGLAGSAARWKGVDLWAEYEARVEPKTDVIPLADLSSIEGQPGLTRSVASRSQIGLRLRSEDIGPQSQRRIDTVLQLLGIPRQFVHVVVDLKDRPTSRSHEQVRSALEHSRAFASVVVLAGIFPLDLTQYQPGIASEPRLDWTTWWQGHCATPNGERLLALGDYTTQCAHYQPSPEVPGSVSLRYTVDDAVLIFRGRQSGSAGGLGHEQMHGHCRLLVNRPDYDGAAFSWGDHRIRCWTNPSNGTGNAVQWRTASITHHITHVVTQVHDPTGSSASARSWARGQETTPCV